MICQDQSKYFIPVIRDTLTKTLIKQIVQLLNLLGRRNHLCIYLHLLYVMGVGTHLLMNAFEGI